MTIGFGRLLGGLFLDKPFTVVALERTVRAALDYHKQVRWPRRQ